MFNSSNIEIVKKSDPQMIKAYDKLHDTRKSYICNRCGGEWKCDWADNKFGSIQDYNSDLDILCPLCGSKDTHEKVYRQLGRD